MSIARNLGHPLDGMTAANLDFQRQHRVRLNVTDRPVGAGIALTGHHELMIPCYTPPSMPSRSHP